MYKAVVKAKQRPCFHIIVEMPVSFLIYLSAYMLCYSTHISEITARMKVHAINVIAAEIFFPPVKVLVLVM